jgi:DNA-binding response OmpR family regulator
MMEPTLLGVLCIGRDDQVAAELYRILSAPDFQPEALGTGQDPSALEVVWVTNQKAALERLRSWTPHVVLVETDHRPQVRVRFCRILRRRLPMAMILAAGEQEPAEPGFSFDGFLPVPLEEAQVAQAVSQALRSADRCTLRVGAIQLDMNSRLVRSPVGESRMTPKQCQLLKLLMERAGEVVNREEIMLAIWNTAYLGDTRTLDVHIRWLRERIEANPSVPIFLETVRGVGYRLNDV